MEGIQLMRLRSRDSCPRHQIVLLLPVQSDVFRLTIVQPSLLLLDSRVEPDAEV